MQYTTGAPSPSTIPPEAYTLDFATMSRPGAADVQLDLFYDYRTNVALYPAFQAFFRAQQLPTLAIWGRGDAIFVPAGAEAFRRDNAGAEVRFVEGGHFAL